MLILDAGGTKAFWETMKFDERDVKITLLNLWQEKVSSENFSSLTGDARDLSRFSDGEFDLVFSNSVIEHVGDFDDQKRMAEEIQRVGGRYFVQTPSRFFPIETHFFFPFFQFLPLKAQLFLARHLDYGWFKRIKGVEKDQLVKSLRLLTANELAEIFPNSNISRERFLGLTKSYVVTGPLTKKAPQ